jgi:hypothetical protein
MYLQYSFNVFDVRFEWIAARALCAGGGWRRKLPREKDWAALQHERTFVFITVYWFEED